MAIDNQFRINELISSGSRAIVSKDSSTGNHTFIQGSKEVVNTPYEHLKGERDGEQTGRIEKPKYNEEELKKAVDVDVDELIGAPKKPQPDVVPREQYDDLERLYREALQDISRLETEKAELQSEIEVLKSELESLRIQLDAAKLQQTVAENNAQQTQQQYTDLIGDFSQAVIKSTKEGIERVSLEAQVKGLQAQKETLKNLLDLTQDQLAGSAAESAAAASGLSPAESNETFWGFNNDKDSYGGDIGWWTHRRNSKAPKNGSAGELVIQNLRDENIPITSIRLSVSKPSQSGWGNTTKILGFNSSISNSVNTNIEQGAKEQFPIYFNTKIGGGDNSSPSPHNVTGPDKEYSGNVGITMTYQDGYVDRANATWVVRKQNGPKWG